MQPEKFKFLGCKSLVLGCVSWLSSHLHHWLGLFCRWNIFDMTFCCEDLDLVTLKISYGTIGSWQLWFCRKLKSAIAGKETLLCHDILFNWVVSPRHRKLILTGLRWKCWRANVLWPGRFGRTMYGPSSPRVGPRKIFFVATLVCPARGWFPEPLLELSTQKTGSTCPLWNNTYIRDFWTNTSINLNTFSNQTMPCYIVQTCFSWLHQLEHIVVVSRDVGC